MTGRLGRPHAEADQGSSMSSQSSQSSLGDGCSLLMITGALLCTNFLFYSAVAFHAHTQAKGTASTAPGPPAPASRLGTSDPESIRNVVSWHGWTGLYTSCQARCLLRQRRSAAPAMAATGSCIERAGQPTAASWLAPIFTTPSNLHPCFVNSTICHEALPCHPHRPGT